MQPYDAPTRQRIVDLYRQGISATDIGELLQRDRSVIGRVLKEEGITLRRGKKPRMFTEEEEKLVATQYRDGLTAREIAETRGCGPSVVLTALKRQGVNIRSVKGINHGLWKGGRIQGPEGYMYVYLDDNDPLVSMRSMNRYAREHRIVMARSLGRALADHEQVHHINGRRADNRLENLQLRSTTHGSGVVFRCADCGSNNVVSHPIAV